MRIALALLLFAATAVASENRIIRICENHNDYPPFRWYSTDTQGRRHVHGYTFTLLQQLLLGSPWHFTVASMPLPRCLRDVKEGQHFDMVANGSDSPARQHDYLLSRTLYRVHFHVFYSRLRFPGPAPAHLRTQLADLRLCGLRGGNFDMFEVPLSHFDMGAENLDAVMEKLRRDRCDAFPYNWEVIDGSARLHPDLLHDIGHSLLEDVPVGSINFMISRHYQDADALLEWLNSAMEKREKDGSMATFWELKEVSTWEQLLTNAE